MEIIFSLVLLAGFLVRVEGVLIIVEAWMIEREDGEREFETTEGYGSLMRSSRVVVPVRLANRGLGECFDVRWWGSFRVCAPLRVKRGCWVVL